MGGVCWWGSDAMKNKPFVVLDTNVLVAALRSRRGASFKILSHLRQGNIEIALSVPLLFEYEDVLNRPGKVPVSSEAVDALLDYLCAVARLQEIFFLWRPALKDLKDDTAFFMSTSYFKKSANS
jgi:putative PIN family toxin of toxin-antitoxin system